MGGLEQAASRVHAGELFRRHAEGPVLSPEGWPYRANAVFNPAAVLVEGEVVLLCRVEDRRGLSHLTVARSRDGVRGWRVDAGPALAPVPGVLEEELGCEDPRAVWLEDLGAYAVTYVAVSRGGPLVALALTRDFRSFERVGPIVPPEDKDAALLPRRVKGRYALIHRPIVRGEAHMWISLSPDLRHWGDHRCLLPARPGFWDGQRVGLGPPPIETPEGWLVLYHGVRVTASGSLYRVGMALLDLEEPWRVLARSQEWVMGPEEPYEWRGDVPGVVFPTGAVRLPGTDRLLVYYGAADRCVGVAEACVGELLDYLLESQRRGRTAAHG